MSGIVHVHAPIKTARIVQALEGGGTECLDRCRCGLSRRMTNRAGTVESSGWRPREELAGPPPARVCAWCTPPHVITPGTMHNATHTLCPTAAREQHASLDAIERERSRT